MWRLAVAEPPLADVLAQTDKVLEQILQASCAIITTINDIGVNFGCFCLRFDLLRAAVECYSIPLVQESPNCMTPQCRVASRIKYLCEKALQLELMTLFAIKQLLTSVQ